MAPATGSTTRTGWRRARTVRIGFDDGSFVLRSPEPLKPYARCIGEWLERWAGRDARRAGLCRAHAAAATGAA